LAGLWWQVTLAPDESAAATNGRGPSVWSPDSRSIVYQIYGSEKTVLMVRRLDQPEPWVLLDDGYSN
jgi:hypothetical protein